MKFKIIFLVIVLANFLLLDKLCVASTLNSSGSRIDNTSAKNDPIFTIFCPEVPILCASASVPPSYASFTAFRNAGGKIEFNCPTGINEASFTMISETSRGTCPRIVTRIYQISDNCENITFCEQIITFEDNQAPTVIAPGPFSTQCYTQFQTNYPVITSVISFTQEWGGQISDNCSAMRDHTIRWLGDERTTFNNCDEVVISRYEIADQCGNTTTAEIRYITQDNRAPEVSGLTQLTVNCDLPLPYATLQEFISAGNSASDNCGLGRIELTKEEVLTNGCPKTVRRTYTIFDACGNSTEFVQTITISDAVKPVIAPIAPITMDCSQGNVNTMIEDWLNSVTATDNCRIDRIENNFNTLLNRCGSPVTVTFTAYDACGNSTSTTSTITIIDEEPPVFNPVTPLVLDCSVGNLQTRINTWLNSVTATDNCGITVVTHNFTTLTSRCGAPHTVTFTATDNCGLTATLTSTITVIDNIAPTWSVQIQNLAVDCAAGNIDTQVTNWLNSARAIDNCGIATVTNDFVSLENSCGSPLNVTFTATDPCGNFRTLTRTITIIDNVSPVFNPFSPLVIDCAAGTIDGQIRNWINLVTARDNCSDPVITHDYTSIENRCGVPLTVTFTASDDCGLTATAVSTITVTDNEPPKFNPISPLIVDCSSGKIDDQIKNWLNAVIATDNCGNPVFTHNYFPINSCGSPQVVTFTATDLCGNTSTLTSSITVTDNIPPVFNPVTPLVIDCDSGTIDSQIHSWINSVTAQDNCGTPVISHDYKSLSYDCGVPIVISFTATDNCGLKTTTSSHVTFTDNEPPFFLGIEPLVIDCVDKDQGQKIANWLNSVQAIDNCTSVTITNDFVSINHACGEPNLVTFTATDGCGNTSSLVQSIILDDQVDPSLKCPPDLTIRYGDPIPMSFKTLDSFIQAGGRATDNCQLVETSFYLISEIVDTMMQQKNIRRAYYIEDKCRNSDVCLHKIIVQDTGTFAQDRTLINPLKLRIYPNPNKGSFEYQIELDIKADILIEVIDFTGRVIHSTTKSILAGIYSERLQLNNLIRGPYLLKASDGQRTIVERFMVE